ncbi:hypothetical protein HPB48_017345 [Haemaphysalis longicornis]|uniref:Uncharacterized protein n=1 Tax=Haemaphysalis longicornis TaxID=44386 RepID=A0A9J6GW91_HAELO|nr:hypothetical protein HPB48_017345 [Haemaphysalis longicornis]
MRAYARRPCVAWAEVGSSTIANCFCKVGFAGDSSEAEVEGRDAPADAEMDRTLVVGERVVMETRRELEEFLHADDAVATNEDLTDEAIVAAVTGAEERQQWTTRRNRNPCRLCRIRKRCK